MPATETDEFFHKLAEAYKFAYGKRSLLGDRFYQPDRDEFEELISNLTSFGYARRFYEKIEGQGFSFKIVESVRISVRSFRIQALLVYHRAVSLISAKIQFWTLRNTNLHMNLLR